jgi:hypothetical protein
MSNLIHGLLPNAITGHRVAYTLEYYPLDVLLLGKAPALKPA